MSADLRQRRKPENEEEEEDEQDSPVLVEREDDAEEEDEEDEDKRRAEALTKRLQGGFTKNPLEAATGTERPTGAMKIPKKRRRAAGAGEEGEKGGIRWTPIIFLLFMFLPALFTAVDYLLQLPIFARFRGPPNYRQCLTDYYRRVHPERLQEVDINSILRKYKGQERKLARNLEARYGRPFKCP